VPLILTQAAAERKEAKAFYVILID